MPEQHNKIEQEKFPISESMEFDDFKVKRRLGSGGMGEVWLAKQLSMEREVALKILSPELVRNDKLVSRFIKEVQTAGKLHHPNIITAYYSGNVAGTKYLACEYIDGVVLDDRLKIDKIFEEKEAMQIIRAIASALEYAWNNFHLIHRDVKPANIIISNNGQPMLMDMGISKFAMEASELTTTGAIIGTPYYMSPEQARADKNIDCRADIYSLGATLYHMVTGNVAFDAPSTVGVITKLISDPLTPPQDKNPKLSDACAAFIELTMAKSSEERPLDWKHFISECDRVIKGYPPKSARPAAGDSMIDIKPPIIPMYNEKTLEIAIESINTNSSKQHIQDRSTSSPATNNIVGIDLGTTYSAISWMDNNGQVQVIPNSDGYATTPSVVFLDDNNIVLVGREAFRATLLEPERGAECFKRDIGHESFSKKVSDQEIRPETLSAYVLKKLKQDAEDKIGQIENVVITVPAYFDDSRRQATINAGKIAGLNVLDIINEPSAAALWYAYQSQPSEDGEIFLIYDLGGGTFDATLMRISSQNNFETIATDGDVMLGGKDWDKRLIDYVAGEFMRKMGADPREDDNAYLELAQRVEEAKRSLSKRPSVSVPVSYAGNQSRVTIDRDLFHNLTADLLGRTQTTLELLLDEAGLNWNDISRIITVGGSSRMTMVREMLERVSGKTFESILDPDLAVVQGAAVFAASIMAKSNNIKSQFQPEINNQLIAMKHRNVNSHSLGVEVNNNATGQKQNYIIIPKNTPIPCEKSTVLGLSTSSDENSTIQVSILEGESMIPEACVKLGNCIISDLPSGLPVGSPVKVTFSYLQDGRIHIQAVVTDANIIASTHLVRNKGLTSGNCENISNMVEDKIMA